MKFLFLWFRYIGVWYMRYVYVLGFEVKFFIYYGLWEKGEVFCEYGILF